MLREFPSDKIKVTENVLFFLSRAPAHYVFPFNLHFSYELKRMVYLSKNLPEIFHFLFCLVCIKRYIFVQQNAWTN